MDTLRCAIRKIAVPALPEERVRQGLLHHMIESLGYPPSLLVVEKELSSLPHLSHLKTSLPERRADILCFSKDIHPKYSLYPLLMIECKSVKIGVREVDQVIGYNHFVKSYFICLANQEELRAGWYDFSEKKYQFVPFLPPYKELLQFAV